MEVVIIPNDAFKELMKKLESLESKIEKLTAKKPRLEDEYIDSVDVCKLLQVSRKTLDRYKAFDMIPTVKIKQKVYYRFGDLEEFMKRNTKLKHKSIL